MATKVVHTVRFEGNAGAGLSTLEGLSKQKPHSWLPFDEIRSEKRATVTPRQASWLSSQVAKRAEGTSLILTAVPATPAA